MTHSFINFDLNIIGPFQKERFAKMQLSRPSNMQCSGFSTFMGLASLYLHPLKKSFLKTLFSQ